MLSKFQDNLPSRWIFPKNKWKSLIGDRPKVFDSLSHRGEGDVTTFLPGVGAVSASKSPLELNMVLRGGGHPGVHPLLVVSSSSSHWI